MISIINNNTAYCYSKYTNRPGYLDRVVIKNENGACQQNREQNIKRTPENNIIDSESSPISFVPIVEKNLFSQKYDKIIKKVESYNESIVFFQTKELLCWRYDLSFFNLISVFSNLLKVLHICWSAVKNNKKILFVNGQSSIDSYTTSKLLNCWLLEQYKRVTLPRKLSNVLNLSLTPLFNSAFKIKTAQTSFKKENSPLNREPFLINKISKYTLGKSTKAKVSFFFDTFAFVDLPKGQGPNRPLKDGVIPPKRLNHSQQLKCNESQKSLKALMKLADFLKLDSSILSKNYYIDLSLYKSAFILPYKVTFQKRDKKMTCIDFYWKTKKKVEKLSSSRIEQSFALISLINRRQEGVKKNKKQFFSTSLNESKQHLNKKAWPTVSGASYNAEKSIYSGFPMKGEELRDNLDLINSFLRINICKRKVEGLHFIRLQTKAAQIAAQQSATGFFEGTNIPGNISNYKIGFKTISNLLNRILVTSITNTDSSTESLPSFAFAFAFAFAFGPSNCSFSNKTSFDYQNRKSGSTIPSSAFYFSTMAENTSQNKQFFKSKLSCLLHYQKQKNKNIYLDSLILSYVAEEKIKIQNKKSVKLYFLPKIFEMVKLNASKAHNNIISLLKLYNLAFFLNDTALHICSDSNPFRKPSFKQNIYLKKNDENISFNKEKKLVKANFHKNHLTTVARFKYVKPFFYSALPQKPSLWYKKTKKLFFANASCYPHHFSIEKVQKLEDKWFLTFSFLYKKEAKKEQQSKSALNEFYKLRFYMILNKSIRNKIIRSSVAHLSINPSNRWNLQKGPDNGCKTTKRNMWFLNNDSVIKQFYLIRQEHQKKVNSYYKAYYHRLLTSSKQEYDKTFSKTPYVGNALADLIFFMNPEKDKNLTNQARNLQIPTMGIVSGTSVKQLGKKHNVKTYGLEDCVSYPILGNPASRSFIRIILNLIIKLLQQQERFVNI